MSPAFLTFGRHQAVTTMLISWTWGLGLVGTRLYDQARDALATIDNNLREAMVMVMIYTADIDKKSELNRAWDEWVDRKNLPLRACVEARLENGDLVDLVVPAAVGG